MLHSLFCCLQTAPPPSQRHGVGSRSASGGSQAALRYLAHWPTHFPVNSHGATVPRLPLVPIGMGVNGCKSGHRGSSGIVHRLLFPVQDGGPRVAKRAAARAREGWGLAPRRAGGVRVRRAAALPDAARRSAQGSTRLDLGERP